MQPISNAELEAAIATLKLGLSLVGVLLAIIAALVGLLWRSMGMQLAAIAAKVDAASAHAARLSTLEGELSLVRNHLHDLRDIVNLNEGKILKLETWRDEHKRYAEQTEGRISGILKDFEERLRKP